MPRTRAAPLFILGLRANHRLDHQLSLYCQRGRSDTFSYLRWKLDATIRNFIMFCFPTTPLSGQKLCPSSVWFQAVSWAHSDPPTDFQLPGLLTKLMLRPQPTLIRQPERF